MEIDDFLQRFTAAMDSPCTKCMTAARDRYAICLANAGNDEVAKKACATQLQADVVACNNGPCKP